MVIAIFRKDQPEGVHLSDLFIDSHSAKKILHTFGDRFRSVLVGVFHWEQIAATDVVRQPPDYCDQERAQSGLAATESSSCSCSSSYSIWKRVADLQVGLLEAADTVTRRPHVRY